MESEGEMAARGKERSGPDLGVALEADLPRQANVEHRAQITTVEHALDLPSFVRREGLELLTAREAAAHISDEPAARGRLVERVGRLLFLCWGGCGHPAVVAICLRA